MADWGIHIHAHSGDPCRDLMRNMVRFGYVLRKFGITLKGLGITAQGLRHEALVEDCIALTAQQPPRRGGGEGLAREQEEAVRLVISRLAVHERGGTTAAYMEPSFTRSRAGRRAVPGGGATGGAVPRCRCMAGTLPAACGWSSSFLLCHCVQRCHGSAPLFRRVSNVLNIWCGQRLCAARLQQCGQLLAAQDANPPASGAFDKPSRQGHDGAPTPGTRQRSTATWPAMVDVELLGGQVVERGGALPHQLVEFLPDGDLGVATCLQMAQAGTGPERLAQHEGDEGDEGEKRHAVDRRRVQDLR